MAVAYMTWAEQRATETVGSTWVWLRSPLASKFAFKGCEPQIYGRLFLIKGIKKVAH